MNEIDKHHLTYSSPHVYKCSCGVVAYFFHDSGFRITEMPKDAIGYLPCGHAACAKTEHFDCIICTMKG